VMGMDWHSSGITTSVIGALKRGLTPLSAELGIHVCGGRGNHSRQTPHELVAIGNRPAGELYAKAHMMQVIRAVDAQLGNAAQVQRASTDANIPLSLGLEAIAIGGGGTGGGAHTLQEWFDCSGRELGLKRILLTLLGLAGRAL